MIFMTREQMREYDRIAIEDYGVPGVVLMENAGRGATDIVEQYQGLGSMVSILCGGGNNGGDGFVIARHLLNRGVPVRVYLFADPEKLAGDARVNRDIYAKMGGVTMDCSKPGAVAKYQHPLAASSVIVDALLGTGLTREVRGPIAEAIELVNECGAPVVAVDVPSGISADTGQVLGVAIRANATATFAHLKRGLLLYPGATHAGSVHVVDIGAPAAVAEQTGWDGRLLREEDLLSLVAPLRGDAEVTDVGRLAVLNGAEGQGGAALICAEAALRSGAGAVTVIVSPSAGRVVEGGLREAVAAAVLRPGREQPLDVTLAAVSDAMANADAVVLGPACHRSELDEAAALHVLSSCERTVILDGVALDIALDHLEVFDEREAPVVMIARLEQLARLAGGDEEAARADLVAIAREQARSRDAVLLVRAGHDVVASPDGRCFINPNGNPGLLTAGTGEALSGLIGSFLCQRHDPVSATCLAAHLLGLAGERAAGERGERGLLASDVVEAVSGILRSWESGQTTLAP